VRGRRLPYGRRRRRVIKGRFCGNARKPGNPRVPVRCSAARAQRKLLVSLARVSRWVYPTGIRVASALALCASVERGWSAFTPSRHPAGWLPVQIRRFADDRLIRNTARPFTLKAFHSHSPGFPDEVGIPWVGSRPQTDRTLKGFHSGRVRLLPYAAIVAFDFQILETLTRMTSLAMPCIFPSGVRLLCNPFRVAVPMGRMHPGYSGKAREPWAGEFNAFGVHNDRAGSFGASHLAVSALSRQRPHTVFTARWPAAPQRPGRWRTPDRRRCA
jgi:hypothetical protein